MKYSSSRLALLAVAGLFAGTVGCAAMPEVPVAPGPGAIFSHYKAPLTVDAPNKPLGSRKGEAATSYLWIPLYGNLSFGWGDATIEQAAKNGNMKSWSHADYEVLSVLGIYTNFKVIAYGE